MTHIPPTEEKVFMTSAKWRQERPHILVVACSDGRYQEALDEFLLNHLGIEDYDRLYAPGGPGALVSSAISHFRGVQFQDEAKFLLDAHGLERVILIVHGPVEGSGPSEARCADYLRKMPGNSVGEMRLRQAEDLSRVATLMKSHKPTVSLQIFAAEVREDRRVQFVPVPVLSDYTFPLWGSADFFSGLDR